MQDTGYTGYRIWDTPGYRICRIQDIQDTEYGIPLGTGYSGYRIYRIQNMGYPFTIVTVEVNISIY